MEIYNGKSTGYTGEAGLAVKPTAIGTANSTLEDAIGLSSRVQDIVGRLIGFVPEAESKNASPVNDGILLYLRDYAESARSRIQQAHAALDRLEKAL